MSVDRAENRNKFRTNLPSIFLKCTGMVYRDSLSCYTSKIFYINYKKIHENCSLRTLQLTYKDTNHTTQVAREREKEIDRQREGEKERN